MNNSIMNNNDGIVIVGGVKNKVSENTIQANTCGGIRLYSGSNSVINNLIESNGIYGLYLDRAQNNIISRNKFTCNGIYIEGWKLSDFFQIIDTTNTANNKPIHYFLNQSSLEINNWDVGQLILVNCSNCIISNMNISNTDVCIESAYSTNIVIENSKFSNSSYGIFLIQTLDNYLNNNTIFLNNQTGIYIQPNNARNIISNNSIYLNKYGIWCSSNNIIFNNSIYSNTKDGIHLRIISDPSGNIYFNNIFHNIEFGINVSNWRDYKNINANLNWWGDSTGPYHSTNNSNAIGDNISDYIDFKPWLQNPAEVSSNLKPIANASANITEGIKSLMVGFNGKGWDKDGVIVSYYWDFDDGNTSSLHNPVHIFQSPGIYNVTLTVEDLLGAKGSDMVIITVYPNSLPIPKINASKINGTAPLTIFFSANNSVDIDGEIKSYSWDFNDGNFSNDINITHIFHYPGIYNVTLTVIDNLGDNATDTIIIMVNKNLAPIAKIIANQTNGTAPLNVSFIGIGIDCDGIIKSYYWDFDDGNVSQLQNTTNIFYTAGVYNVTFTIIDNLNSIGQDYIIIVIEPKPLDSDADGIPDLLDTDDDNDGYNDSIELAIGTDPFDSNSTPPDMDKDFIPDSKDPDIDGDGVPNEEDDYPYDQTKWKEEKSDFTPIFIALIIIVIIILLLILFVKISKNNLKRKKRKKRK